MKPCKIIDQMPQQVGKTGGVLCNNWAGNSYVNRHFYRPTGVKLTKAQKEDSNTKFHYPGAVIGDPKLNAFPNTIRNVIDLDYGAMYPSIIILNNLFPDTIKYKIWIDPRQFKEGLCINNGIGANHDPDDTQLDYADAIIGDYLTGNLLAFMHTWFGAPDVDQVLAYIYRRRLENGEVSKY